MRINRESFSTKMKPTDTQIINWLQEAGSPAGILFDPKGLFDDDRWYTKTPDGKRKYHKSLRAAAWSVMARSK